MNDAPTVTIRDAHPDDTEVLVAMIVELAEFEHARDEVEVDVPTLRDVLFGGAPTVFCDIAEIDGAVVGSSIWFVNYSTWTGTHGIYLEDLYVRPAARRSGVARALITTLARRAADRGYRRVEWSVLDWNVNAIGLYESVGAFPLDEWIRYRLAGDALVALGAGEPPGAQG